MIPHGLRRRPQLQRLGSVRISFQFLGINETISRVCKTAKVFRVTSTRVTPGGKSPFSGRSSKVIATFCAPHIPTDITKKTHAHQYPRIDRTKDFMLKVYKHELPQLFTLY
jgi:hypothetical protein